MKLNLIPGGNAKAAVIEANKQHARSLGLQSILEYRGRAPLAIVGGSPSVKKHLDRLRHWHGEIWGINAVASWLIKRGIPATMITLDPGPQPDDAFEGVKRAIMSDQACPQDFARLSDAKVYIFGVSEGIPNCGTTATAAAVIAPYVHIADVTFFGCESSWKVQENFNVTSAPDPTLQFSLIVRVGKKFFQTKPEYLQQAEHLSTIIRKLPGVFREKSGGLLRAMCADPDYDIVAVSNKLQELANRQNAIFDEYRAGGQLPMERLLEVYEQVSAA